MDKCNNLNGRELDHISSRTRKVLQDLLKDRVKDKSDIEDLAKALGKTTSLVKKMLYKGNGGLDVWIKALSYIYQIDEDSLKSLRNGLHWQKPLKCSDEIWLSIQNEFNASEEDMQYLAMCAKEAMRIKVELLSIKKRRCK